METIIRPDHCHCCGRSPSVFPDVTIVHTMGMIMQTRTCGDCYSTCTMGEVCSVCPD